MNFRDKEKKRYQRLKQRKQTLFSEAALMDGIYRGIRRPFCLHERYSHENLFEAIRPAAIAYFDARHIRWHDGTQERHRPSNHLCCSQSCCVNFLFPMVNNPNLLKRVFMRFYPDFVETLAIDVDLPPIENRQMPYMSFEWIGVNDYLNEHVGKRGARTRGANYTSADFMFRFKRSDGVIQIVLGEWKYTEYYSFKDFGTMTSPRDEKPEKRKRIYREPFNRQNGVFISRYERLYDTLFFEPFYQLMRLQLLAQEMESKNEMNATSVSVIHICPKANKEFRNRVTSPELAKMFPEKDTLEIWKDLVPKDKFMSISTETLLHTITEQSSPEERKWVEYLKLRYGWNSDQL